MSRSAPLLTCLARFVAGEAAPPARVRVPFSRDVPLAYGRRPPQRSALRVWIARNRYSISFLKSAAIGAITLTCPTAGESNAISQRCNQKRPCARLSLSEPP
jgi:hypothetical protein